MPTARSCGLASVRTPASLEWICRRLEGDGGAVDTPIGAVPTPDDLWLDGIAATAEQVRAALAVNPDDWRAELPTMKEHFATFGDQLPSALLDELATLERNLA